VHVASSPGVREAPADSHLHLTRSPLPTPARFALGALVPAAIIVAIILITTGSSNHAPSRLPPPAKLPALPLAFANGGIGLTGRLPRDWTAVRGSGFVQLASKRRDATIEVAARPVFPGTKPPLLKPAVDAIRKAYNSVTVKHALGTTLGGVPARSVVLYARNKHGVPIRVLVAAAQGRRTAWVLEAFTAQKASQQALVEAQQIVLSLHLTG
jgi:hypothetical protein